MTDRDPTISKIVPFCRQWHVIHEVDLVGLAADHATLRQLCTELEACADALPYPLPPHRLRSLCLRLQNFIVRNERQDERLLQKLFGPDLDAPLTRALLYNLQAWHATDATHAHDLITALDPTASDHERFSVEARGYMLRCFFDGCRRAMDFEALAILTLGGNRLTPAARALLIEQLARTATA